MAKIKGPLMSLDAAGNYASRLQFRHGWGGVHVYKPMDPRRQNQAPPTEAQQRVRTAYAQLIVDWRALTTQEHEDWNLYGASLTPPLSGWNAYVMKHLTSTLAPQEITLTVITRTPVAIIVAIRPDQRLKRILPLASFVSSEG